MSKEKKKKKRGFKHCFYCKHFDEDRFWDSRKIKTQAFCGKKGELKPIDYREGESGCKDFKRR